MHSHAPTTYLPHKLHSTMQRCKLAQNQNPLLFFVHCDAKTRWHFGQIDVHEIISSTLKKTPKHLKIASAHTHNTDPRNCKSLDDNHCFYQTPPSTSLVTRFIYNFQCSLKLDQTRSILFPSVKTTSKGIYHKRW